jgi:hypothetical protein
MTARDFVVRLIVVSVGFAVHWQELDGVHASVEAAPVAAQARRTTAVLRLDASGVSEPMNFIVPSDTRALTVIVEGETQKLYGLASLRTADGVERVNLDTSKSNGTRMEESYYKEKIGTMPGDFYQNIRLGTFTVIYPYAPGQPLEAGASELRVLSNATDGDVLVTVLMPRDDGSRILHVNIIEVSDYPFDERSPSFLPAAGSILAQAGIQVVVDEVRFMSRTPFSNITEWTEPQESPGSQLAQLATAGRAVVSSDALNIFVVDSLPRSIYGVSLGTPGPPISSSYYYGVVLRRVSSVLMAQVFAHELSHFIGLQHPVDVCLSGTRHTDPLPDTEPDTNNLMEGTGTMLTAGQMFALTRSALLRER